MKDDNYIIRYFCYFANAILRECKNHFAGHSARVANPTRFRIFLSTQSNREILK